MKGSEMSYEIAAFESFKFKIGDFVQVKAQRVEVENLNRCTDEQFAKTVETEQRLLSGGIEGPFTFMGTVATCFVGMVIHRKLVETARGTFRYYFIRGTSIASEVWEEELESAEGVALG